MRWAIRYTAVYHRRTRGNTEAVPGSHKTRWDGKIIHPFRYVHRNTEEQIEVVITETQAKALSKQMESGAVKTCDGWTLLELCTQAEPVNTP